VYVLRDERKIQIFLALYVDDLLIFSKTINSINNIKTYLHDEFEMIDLG
jgi:hypothetical protein